MEKNFYVNDSLGSFSTPDEAVNMTHEVQKALKDGRNLKLHKIAPNSHQKWNAYRKTIVLRASRISLWELMVFQPTAVLAYHVKLTLIPLQ